MRFHLTFAALSTSSFCQDCASASLHYRDHGAFPPDLAAFLPGWRPESEL
jgi:hypothetical protein